MTDPAEPAWPQFSQGRPVADTGWKQPPGQPGAAVPRPDDPTVVDASLIPAPDPTPVAAEPAASKLCLQCGGEVDTDGYCTQCGAKAPTEREHFEESPAAWVGAVCDRGVKHARNEDALATDADEAMGSRAVLVVCDGVTTSTDSDVAALAAARAARDVLVEGRPEDMGTPASRSAAVSGLFARAAAVANDAVAHHTAAGEKNPAACTFVAALVLDNVVYAGNVGDSRAYWLPDSGDGAILTRDDSMAEDSIASGVPPSRPRLRRTPTPSALARGRCCGRRAAGRVHARAGSGLGAGVLGRPVELRVRAVRDRQGRVGRRRYGELLAGKVSPGDSSAASNRVDSPGTRRDRPRDGQLGDRPGRARQHLGLPRPRGRQARPGRAGGGGRRDRHVQDHA